MKCVHNIYVLVNVVFQVCVCVYLCVCVFIYYTIHLDICAELKKSMTLYFLCMVLYLLNECSGHYKSRQSKEKPINPVLLKRSCMIWCENVLVSAGRHDQPQQAIYLHGNKKFIAKLIIFIVTLVYTRQLVSSSHTVHFRSPF